MFETKCVIVYNTVCLEVGQIVMLAIYPACNIGADDPCLACIKRQLCRLLYLLAVFSNRDITGVSKSSENG